MTSFWDPAFINTLYFFEFMREDTHHIIQVNFSFVLNKHKDYSLFSHFIQEYLDGSTLLKTPDFSMSGVQEVDAQFLT